MGGHYRHRERQRSTGTDIPEMRDVGRVGKWYMRLVEGTYMLPFNTVLTLFVFNWHSWEMAVCGSQGV